MKKIKEAEEKKPKKDSKKKENANAETQKIHEINFESVKRTAPVIHEIKTEAERTPAPELRRETPREQLSGVPEFYESVQGRQRETSSEERRTRSVYQTTAEQQRKFLENVSVASSSAFRPRDFLRSPDASAALRAQIEESNSQYYDVTKQDAPQSERRREHWRGAG